MPIRPPRPCAWPSCPKLARTRYCPTHQATYQAKDRERRSAHDRERGSAASRGYGPKWREARAGFLAKHGQCVDCRQRATVVDHDTPHRRDWAKFWDQATWKPRCKRCHDAKTAGQDGGFGNRRTGGECPKMVTTAPGPRTSYFFRSVKMDLRRC